MKPGAISVLLVDDHAVVRAGYRTYLEQLDEFEVVAEADSADDAYLAYKRWRPGLVVMDIRMPGASGIEASRRILAHDASARILLFSMYTSTTFLRQALELGIKGMVGKESTPDTLRDAALAVARGKPYVDGQLAQALVFETHASPLDALSPREFELLQLMVGGATAEEMAQALSVSSKTVANRASSIRQKLGATTDIQLLKIAVEAGVVSWLGPDSQISEDTAAPSLKKPG